MDWENDRIIERYLSIYLSFYHYIYHSIHPSNFSIILSVHKAYKIWNIKAFQMTKLLFLFAT